jgi:hypothetical protein
MSTNIMLGILAAIFFGLVLPVAVAFGWLFNILFCLWVFLGWLVRVAYWAWKILREEVARPIRVIRKALSRKEFHVNKMESFDANEEHIYF